MPVNLKPWQGIVIPSVLISFIGYSSHYFIFSVDLSRGQQIWYEFCMTMLWISYLIAIYKEPGSPPKNFKPVEGQWKRWCKKCQLYKPERAHHCKTCKKCVLKMDHHCPWTANCVGHANMPHFLRFLLWVEYTTGYTLYQLIRRLMSYWNDRNLPAYLISKTPLTMTIILVPLSAFVLLTVGILTMRCFYHIIITGMTQIESWEYERLESQMASGRLRHKIKRNYELLFGKELKNVTSWASGSNALREPPENNSSSLYFTVDDLVFPYEINPWTNLIQAFGYPWNWFLPWGKPLGDGLHYPKNEFSNVEDQDIGSLPWPPDGSHQDTIQQEEPFNDIIQDNEQVVTRRMIDPRSNMKRTEWFNDFGEKLSDFGIDVDAETFDEPDSSNTASTSANK